MSSDSGKANGSSSTVGNGRGEAGRDDGRDPAAQGPNAQTPNAQGPIAAARGAAGPEPGNPMRAAQTSMRQPLARRFYQAVTVDGAPDGAGARVLLDGRPARTPRKAPLLLPTAPLAAAVAEEWARVTQSIDPAAMPLTRLANTALDGVTGREADVRADIVKYASSDLLCYRAERPEGLVERQAALWDPVLAWAGGCCGAPFAVQRGIVHVAQPPAALAGIAHEIAGLGTFHLTALHTITSLTGSALLALAVHARQLAGEAAWAAAHVDEDWQIAEWGEDAEAAARRARRKTEMDAAARLLALLG